MSAHNSAKNQLNILHLEDDADDAELIRLTLEATHGPAELLRVASRQAFAAALATDRFDLVLSDYSVPGFDGPAALAIVRQTKPDMPFIIVSGALD